MSEIAKPVEATPAPAAIGGTDSTPVPSTTPAAATTDSAPATDAITPSSQTAPVAPKDETVEKGAAKVEGPPAGEGILGYKKPGLIQSLRFSKRFFWFSDEAFKTDTLDSYLRTEKAEIAHPNAAWAHETGKGLLFFAKRAEDKAAPSGIMNLAEISDVTKEGSNDFSFRLNGHKHVFQAASTAEQSSWIVAIETKATEAKGLKEGLIGSEGYKKHIERFNKLGVGAATTGSSLPSLSKSKERKETSTPRKSLETKAKETVKKDKVDSGSASSSDIEKKDKKSKSRSQSRKRSSIFGLLGNKKDEQEVKKDEKAEEKAEKQHDKEIAKEEKKHEKDVAKEHHHHDKDVAKEEKKHEKEIAKEEHKHEKELAKEEKKLEKEEKQAEAKASHQPSDVAEAGAATVVAAAPAAVAGTHDKKTDETKPELSTTKSMDTHEKKGGKRSSIFGTFFGGRKDVTSPTTEKTENGAAPVVPAKDTEVAPVAETAPKIDEPVHSKPIDTAAVTAPVDTAIAAHDLPANSAHAQTTTGSTTTKSPTTPSHKGGVMGFFKRQDSKTEQKKADEPVASPAATTEAGATSESPAATTSEAKPALKEKRRTSIFNSLGTKKEKSDTEVTEGETKKSPLPQKLGGLFRRPSKAVKSEETQTEPTATATETAPIAEGTEGAAAPSAKDEPALTNGTTEASKESVDPVPGAFSTGTPEVKASA